MWTCALCDRTFKNNHQQHYCANRSIAGFLAGKTETALSLFDHLMAKLSEIGPIQLHATKTMIVFSSPLNFVYITAVGKNFVDLILPFNEPFNDNLCFRKIALVPGTNDYNHHLRILFKEDINHEVMDYLKRAYGNGKNL